MVLVSSLLLPLGLTLGASLATTAILVARSTPASASTLPSVASITQMGLASYALTTSGNVYSWGSNAQGQLGNGSNADIGFAPPSLQDSQTTPTEVLGVGGTGHLSGIASLTAVSGTVYALSTLGNVYAWGLAQDGQIGNGTAPFGQSTPVEVEGVGGVGYLSDVVQVAALNWTAYAVTSSGNVYAWGDGADGQLGNGTTTSSQTTPVEVSGVGGSGFLGDVTTLYVGPNIGSSTQREAFALTSSGN
ncbi:MAG TPA: hypothetical protein VNV83_05720, partial [Acidimicrobiales bacterium]|nr:hypothetical protein [Acidimicrobiales bacterium]